MSEAVAEPTIHLEPPHSTPPESAQRSLALDALRGLAILAMYLSGIVPWDGLPAWMYHGQEPPPSHQFNPNHPGITWVDLIFPFFLFAMGAAIPLAQSKAIGRGVPLWRLTLNALVRGGLLVAFAVYVQHVRPYDQTDKPDTHTWLLALLTFGIALPMFARLPKKIPLWAAIAVRLVGWSAAAYVLSVLTFPDKHGFSLDRSDIIILVLSNMAFVASVVWLLTRSSDRLRIGVMAAVFALRLTAYIPGSPGFGLWHLNIPYLDWAFQFSFLPYLLVLIPGTMVGDHLLRRPENRITWSDGRLASLALLTFATIVAAMVLFYNRINPLWAAPLALLTVAVVNKPQSDADERLRSLVALGMMLLLVGCLFEPFQIGIKKDPPTFSYLLATPGLATLMLVSLMAVEKLRPNLLALRFLGTTGRNPMLAYLAITNLIAPLWALTIGNVVEGWLAGPYLGLIRAFVQVILLGLMVAGFSKANLYLRA